MQSAFPVIAARKPMAPQPFRSENGCGGTIVLQRLLVILIAFILAGVAALVWFRSRSDAPSVESAAQNVMPIIEKQPPVISTRHFNPASPPSDMPPLHPGELAECDANYMSGAVVSGRTRGFGGHATLTVTQVKVTLQLAITIWVPDDVTQHVLEHEEGHRQIAEFYYASADQLAGRIAASYIGKQIAVTGGEAEANQSLQKIGADITDEYNKQLDPNPAQLRYDDITDHARNDTPVQDAVAQVTIR
jgi:hypothetical protein